MGTENIRRLLIVDDEPDMLVLLRKVLAKNCECEVFVANSGAQALEVLDAYVPDVILTDIMMPDIDGLQLLEAVKRLDMNISVVVMTAYGTIEMAVKSLKKGAYDFLEKPFDNTKVSQIILRAFERTHLLRENILLQEELNKSDRATDFIGRSKPLQKAIQLLTRLGKSDATVLIRGESGTGKEVAARTIHNMSDRRGRRMVIVNCPALPDQILESELFGYVKGAFTGADTNKDGLFLEAAGSTILLDEVADIPVSLQTKLLRVLQEKEIQPLGQTKTVKVDVRVLASTNQDLEEKISKGEFREDLFYRLNVMTVTMPSLVEIRDDIPILAQYFLAQYTKEYQREGMEFSHDALKCLLRRRWKGNVRELQNRINRAVLLTAGPVITPDDLLDSDELLADKEDGLGVSIPICVHNLVYKDAKEEVLNHFSTRYLRLALTESGGNVSAAARASGMERQAFQRLMRRFEIHTQLFKS